MIDGQGGRQQARVVSLIGPDGMMVGKRDHFSGVDVADDPISRGGSDRLGIQSAGCEDGDCQQRAHEEWIQTAERRQRRETRHK
jgi:hypothetical protein